MLNICCIAILLKTVFLLWFLEAKNLCFVTKNFWKSSYICVFILSKKPCNWFHKNLHKSGMVGRRKRPDALLNRIFNALSIGVQYTLSFQWTNFGLKCLYIKGTVSSKSRCNFTYKLLCGGCSVTFYREVEHLQEFPPACQCREKHP